MSSPKYNDEQIWESGYDGHEEAQKRRMANLPFAVKLAWLEEAHELVMYLQKSRRKQSSTKGHEEGKVEDSI